jgi:uncharacterized membrane protein
MTRRTGWASLVFERGHERLNAFSDGVVAIAITLLVFPITDLATGSHGANVVTVVHEHSGTFLTFFITFLVIAKLWVDNHGLFRDLRAYTRPLLWTHMLWLLSIVFMPFPMDVLSSADDHDFPNSAVYVGTLLLAVTCLFIEYVIVLRTPSLQERDVNVRPGLINAAVDTLAMLVAFVLTLAVPGWGLRPLLLLVLGAIVGRALGPRFGGRRVGSPDREDT